MVIMAFNDYFVSQFEMVETMKKRRTYSKYAQEVALLLGKQIQLGRKQRNWSEMNLAERVGISRATLQKIERGEMTCAIGMVLEAAAIVGLNLFERDRLPLSISIDQTVNNIALLPKRNQQQTKVVDDDF
jgi:ribosome-binding protein aMBF1 (putative translation factor)